MDVNGTHFYLLQGAADWARCQDTGAGTIALGDSAALRALVFQFPTPAGAGVDLGDPALRRRGGARDRYGNWYWIDGDGARVLVRSSGSDALSLFWPAKAAAAATTAVTARGAFGPLDAAPAPPPCRLGGLAVSDDHYLIVGTLDQPGLLVFDLHNGGPPRHLRWPDTQPFQPFDMAARPGGGVFVLDRANRGYWALDRQLGVIAPAPSAPLPPDTFRASSGDPADDRPPTLAFPAGIALGVASPLDDAGDPVAIEALPDGSVLILDRAPRPTVHRYLLERRLGSAPLDLGPVLAPPVMTPPALGADIAFVAGAAGDVDRLYVPAAGGEQAYAFVVSWRTAPFAVVADSAAPFLPMRLFGGKGLVQAGGAAYYDFAATGIPSPPSTATSDAAGQPALAPADSVTWLPLVAQRRPRFEREGTFDTPALDGVEPGCVWHRLLFDGCLAPTGGVAIWSRTADERADLERAPWSPEPAPRRRASGREQPFVPPAGDGAAAGSDAGTFELLFQRARGRWLQLRVQLRGDGRTSPRLRALRIWYPRFSYLAQYLPAAYREDAESASFLDRFLANLEGVFTSVEDRMAAAQALFDARTAPPEALDWLAGWFGVALDPAWSVGKRRLFLRHAMDFFRIRGTVRGLQAALRLVIDDCADDQVFTQDGASAPASIRIVEWYRLRTLPPLALGDPDPTSGIRQVTTPPPWTPAQGGAALLALYRAVVRSAGVTTPIAAFPVREPGDGSAPLWHQFLLDVLSLSGTAGAGGGDAVAWTAFLSARYPDVAALNAAWRLSLSSIAELPLPGSLPADGPPLQDWYQFQLGGARFVPSGQRWIPAQGRAALLDRWSQYLHAAGAAAADLPLAPPADPAAAALWRQFADGVLGFVPGADARAQQGWRDFLARRYRRVAALNQAQGGRAASFAELALPASLPADGAALRDWYDFQAIAVASLATGHRFTVLLPVPAREAFALDLHQQRRDLARRIVDLEKPAHTLYDVKFYWAMFRVGEARLAIDTLLDQSSRAPELMPPAVLGQAFLAESRLGATPTERESERPILGTYPLRSRTKTEEMRS